MGNPSRTLQNKAAELRLPIKGSARRHDAQPKIDDCDYVFRRARTPFSGYGKNKAALDKAVFAAMRKQAKKGVGRLNPCRTGPCTTSANREDPDGSSRACGRILQSECLGTSLPALRDFVTGIPTRTML